MGKNFIVDVKVDISKPSCRGRRYNSAAVDNSRRLPKYVISDSLDSL